LDPQAQAIVTIPHQTPKEMAEADESNTNNSILRLFNNISGLQYNVNKCLTKDEDGEK
jgi:hypothetical protein